MATIEEIEAEYDEETRKGMAAELTADADKLQRIAYEVCDRYDHLVALSDRLRHDARQMRMEALRFYCEHDNATGLNGEDLWECDDCGREFVRSDFGAIA